MRQAPLFHHIALNVDDFAAVYWTAREAQACTTRAHSSPRCTNSPTERFRCTCATPAGNLVEIDWARWRGRWIRASGKTLVPLSATAPQTGAALTATLYLGRRDGGAGEAGVCDHHGDGPNVA